MSGEDSHLEEAYEDRYFSGDEDWDEPKVNDGYGPGDNPNDPNGSWSPAEDDPTSEQIEASRPEPSSPIYGGEQQVSGGPRQLVVMQPLADRSAMAHKERIQLLDSDIREAMALAAIRLNNEAMKYSVTGYVWSLEDIKYDMGAPRILTATLRVARPGE